MKYVHTKFQKTELQDSTPPDALILPRPISLTAIVVSYPVCDESSSRLGLSVDPDLPGPPDPDPVDPL